MPSWSDSTSYSTAKTAVQSYAASNPDASAWSPTACGWRIVIKNSLGGSALSQWREADNPNGSEHQLEGIVALCDNVNPLWRRIYKLQRYA